MNNLLDSFVECELRFIKRDIENVFAERTDTLAVVIKGSKYAKHSVIVRDNKEYSGFLNRPIGEFLLSLKNNNDNFYKTFLYSRNGVTYGEGPFCHFEVEDSEHTRKQGVYAYFSHDNPEKPKYIGISTQGMLFKNRVNNGHGKITDGNCYLKRQTTNCRINYLINEIENSKPVTLFVNDMTSCSYDEIDKFETLLIEEIDPVWNIKKRNWMKSYLRQLNN